MGAGLEVDGLKVCIEMQPNALYSLCELHAKGLKRPNPIFTSRTFADLFAAHLLLSCSCTLTAVSSSSQSSTVYPILYRMTLIPSPSCTLLLLDMFLVMHNVVLQMLDFLPQFPNLLLISCLAAVGGAFAQGYSLLLGNEEMATMERVTVVVKVRVEMSLHGVGWRAGGQEGGRLGFAAAFEGEDFVETHG